MARPTRGALLDRWAAEGKTNDIVRLTEIRKRGQDHTWVQRLPNSKNPALTPVEWLTAVRIRQGVWLVREPITCSECGGVMDPQGVHCTCCAQAESTRGHNDLRNQVHACMREVDSTALTT